MANVLIDLECPIGSTTKLIKVLREKGLNTQLISYNIIRLRLTESIDKSRLNYFLDKVESLFTTIYDLRNNWNVLCIESWVEEDFVQRLFTSKLVEIDNTCIYLRPGSRNRVVYKIAWISKCSSTGGFTIPKSVSRLCIEKTLGEDIETKLITSLDKIRRFLAISSSLSSSNI
ncbi:MAG: hypothetical protein QXE81_04235 [Desulfurococcaceae archaeon]